VVRSGLLDVPLDRDEGEYAYIGALLMDGVPPYVRAWNMKMPGIYVLYAGVMTVFGRTTAGVHLGLLAVNLVSIGLVFLLGRRLLGAAGGVGAAALFATMSFHPMLHGLAAYAEHYLLPFVIAGSLVLLAATDAKSQALFATSGLLFGLAFVVKQSGGVFGLFALAWIIVSGFEARLPVGAIGTRVAALLAGALVPFLVVCGWLALSGSFANFWFWTFTYAAQYGALQNFAGAAFSFVIVVDEVLPSAWPLLVLTAIGAGAPAWNTSLHDRRWFLWLLLAASVVATSLGFYYRTQYFLLLLPALCLLAGAGAATLARALAPWHRALPLAAAAAVIGAALAPVVYHRDLLFQSTGRQISRAVNGRNPFVEAVEIARYLRERSQKDDRIAVIGSEPQIYFYADRPAATGYIYMYPLMERHPYAREMQEHLIRELSAARPRYLVFVNVHASWLSVPGSDQTLVRWFGSYWPQFERVGIADIVSRDVTHYRWDAAAREYAPESTLWVAVFRRKD
jgi:hypothetical protein